MEPIEEATGLAKLRLEARTAKNWQEADRLRDEISSVGFSVLDTPDGFTLERITHKTLTSIKALKPDSITFNHPDTVVCLLVEGWLEDTVESIKRILLFTAFPIAILDLSQQEDIHGALLELSTLHPERVEVVTVNQSMMEVGWATAYNQLIQAVVAENVVIMDISTLFEGDAISPLIQHLQGNSAVGWKGANVATDWLSFESSTGSVDALLSYLLVVKGSVFLSYSFDPKAKFYRNADLEWSLQMRSEGHTLFAIIEDLPCTQGRHHGYHDSDEEYRTRESKRNYDRLLRKFRGKSEILVRPST